MINIVKKNKDAIDYIKYTYILILNSSAIILWLNYS